VTPPVAVGMDMVANRQVTLDLFDVSPRVGSWKFCSGTYSLYSPPLQRGVSILGRSLDTFAMDGPKWEKRQVLFIQDELGLWASGWRHMCTQLSYTQFVVSRRRLLTGLHDAA